MAVVVVQNYQPNAFIAFPGDIGVRIDNIDLYAAKAMLEPMGINCKMLDDHISADEIEVKKK